MTILEDTNINYIGMVKVFCKNTGTSLEFNEGTQLLEIETAFNFEKPYPIIAAKVNNVSAGLRYRVYKNQTVEFLDYSSYAGRGVYRRSLCFLLCKAARDLFPGCRITLRRPIAKGYLCNITKTDNSPLSQDDIDSLTSRMEELVKANIDFHRHEAPIEEVIELFKKMGYEDKVKLLETSGSVYVNYYTLDGTPDYFYDALLPSTGYLKIWKLTPYHNGFILRVPDRHSPEELAPFYIQEKTFNIFLENLLWNKIMNLENVGDVNLACKRGEAGNLIQVSEALQEKKIVQIAEEINRRYHSQEDPVKVVLITGPSSSGKSTFCRRLAIQLMACGINPVFFSTDDYFVNRVDTPKLPDGSYDFDNFETVDHKALEKDVVKLLNGEEVEIPEYNFVTGIREYNGKKIQLNESKILLIEGIHALNPQLIPQIPDKNKFKIFISILTSLSLDDHNCIPTSDNRLLRRIVRDYNKGAFTPQETIRQWPNVRRSEVQWVYPYQEHADVLFNSAYLIEFAVMRSHAEQILRTIPKNCPEYNEAHRLLKFLSYFTIVSDKELPPTSMIRSFIG